MPWDQRRRAPLPVCSADMTTHCSFSLPVVPPGVDGYRETDCPVLLLFSMLTEESSGITHMFAYLTLVFLFYAIAALVIYHLLKRYRTSGTRLVLVSMIIGIGSTPAN
jgi:hypothetical protein